MMMGIDNSRLLLRLLYNTINTDVLMYQATEDNGIEDNMNLDTNIQDNYFDIFDNPKNSNIQNFDLIPLLFRIDLQYYLYHNNSHLDIHLSISFLLRQFENLVSMFYNHLQMVLQNETINNIINSSLFKKQFSKQYVPV